MGILDGLFGGKSNSTPAFNGAGAASPYLNEIPGVAHGNYDPYIDMGNRSQNNARWQYEAMTNDPMAFLNHLMSGYKTSEGYNFEKDLLTKELSNTANAGGIAGTPYDQLNQGSQVQGLLSKDMQQYLMNALGIQKTGLIGEQGIADKGFEASKALADLLGGSLNQQGGLAFNSALQNQNFQTNQTNQQNANKQGLFQALAKALGVAGGAVFGGLPGATAASKIGSGIFG